MATSPNQFAQAQAGLAEVYFGEMEHALELGDSSLQMLLAHSAFLGSEVELSDVVAPVAERLTNIAKASIGMLQTLVDAGAITIPEEGFVLTAPETLELGAGDDEVDLNGQGELDDQTVSGEGESTDTGGTSADAVTSSEVVDQEREVSYERSCAENLLTEIFGEARKAQIEALSDVEMTTFGVIVKNTFMQIPIGPRGKASQADRSEQLAKYIAGVDHQEIADEYGMTVSNLRGAIRRLPEASFSKVDPATKDQLFDATLDKIVSVK